MISLGRNSKPAYPDELSAVYSSVQNPDFSGRIIGESTLDDVNKLEVYSLKEKLRVRDSKSTLPDLEDIEFLRDLQLVKYDGDVERLTIAGLLFVGKESSMVSMGKPYPRYRSFNDAVSLTIFSAIDNTEFVKFITEVQDKNSKIMSLAEMMILRDLLDNRKEQLSELSRKVQKSLDETKKSCNELINSGLIEIVGKEYMLTAKVYEALKSDVEYTRDKTVQYIKVKNMILEYLQTNDQITSAEIQEMCGFTKQQARSVIDKMRSEKLISLNGKGPAARYVIFDGLSDN